MTVEASSKRRKRQSPCYGIYMLFPFVAGIMFFIAEFHQISISFIASSDTMGFFPLTLAEEGDSDSALSEVSPLVKAASLGALLSSPLTLGVSTSTSFSGFSVGGILKRGLLCDASQRARLAIRPHGTSQRRAAAEPVERASTNLTVGFRRAGVSSGCRSTAVLLVHPPPQDVEVARLNASRLKLTQLELLAVLVDEPLATVQIVRNQGQEMTPGAGHDVLCVVVTAEKNDLAPVALGSGREVDGQVVSTPVSDHRNPGGMSISFADRVRRDRFLTRYKGLPPSRLILWSWSKSSG
ncbi:hypothetical protein N8I77_008752 [Diaporthe amygdali]|uniref:Uncharacterized protein n=1 Tax=Phomopsis amygdali TaxID=1214568 RepID=A0AAD9S893_PHOAM|nr:hypothetical protein N8I77_008752 [Diaporthe amygdali]